MDTDAFTVSYPCWALMAESSLETTAAGEPTLGEEARYMFLPTSDGERAVPIFTDEDLAIRFMDEEETNDCVAVAIDNQEDLAALLIDAKAVASLVVFDPARSTGWNRRHWPIDYVIKSLQ